MRIYNIYVNENREILLRDIKIEFSDAGPLTQPDAACTHRSG